MTPERLDAIRADAADVEKRAGRIVTWRAMPHRFAVESGLRTQGLRAPRLAVHLRDLLAEVDVLEGRAWVCQGPDCYAIHPMTTAPVFGEYPEDGDVFCSPACLDAYDRLGDEVTR